MTAAATESSAPLALIQGEPIALRSTRVLLGWLPEQEALLQLLGRNALPQDNITAIKEQIDRTRTAVQARPKTEPADPVVQGDRDLLDQIAARPDVRASFTDAPWRIEWVDLTRILSIQKLITTEGLDLRVGAVQDDPAAIAELCLPANQPASPLGGFMDQDGLAITISSLNPNLRVVSAQPHEALVATSPELPPQKMQAITFLVNLGASYVQVAEYQGRYFLRDGYHRAAGLLHAGVSHIPAVVIDAPTFRYVVPTPGLFDHEIAFSDHAPLLTDFWDDSVSAEARQPAVRKVIRIRAEQFAVQG
jgi:hypothetical protein